MAIHDHRSQRLYLDVPFAEGRQIDLSREQANYLLNVLRLSTGVTVRIFNGMDGEWEAELIATGRKKASLTPKSRARAQPAESTLVYCFAPLKQGRLDYMMQKATEMGAGTIQPVLTQRTMVRKPNLERMHANAIEAAEQCGILNIPAVRSPVELSQLRESLSKETCLFVCDEERPEHDGLERLEQKEASAIALLIGPEGGFSDDERKIMRSWENTYFLGLGPRILRADTAAVAALAILQAKLGDWYASK